MKNPLKYLKFTEENKISAFVLGAIETYIKKSLLQNVFKQVIIFYIIYNI